MRVMAVVGIVCLFLLIPQAFCDVQEQIDFADGLFARGFYDMALVEYGKLMESEDLKVREVSTFRYSECLFYLGKLEEALASYKRYLEQFPTAERAGRACVRIGEILLKLGKAQEAYSFLSGKIGELQGRDKIAALYFMGKADSALGKKDEAEKLFEQVIGTGSGEGRALLPFARAEYAELLKARGKLDEALAQLSYAVEEAEDEILKASLIYTKGEFLKEAGRYEEARAVYKEIAEKYSDTPFFDKAYLAYMWTLYEEGKYKDAIGFAKDNIGKVGKPTQAAMLYMVGNCLYDMGNFQDALKHYQQVWELFPDSEYAGKARIKAGWCYYNLKDYKKSYETIKDFVDKDDEATFLAGILDFDQEKYGAAAGRLLDMAKKFPTSRFVGDAVYKAGIALDKMGKYEEAIATLTEWAGKLKGKHSGAELLLLAGQIASQRQDFKKAQEVLSRFEELFPQDPLLEEGLYRLGIACYNVKDYEGMEEAFRKLLDKFGEGQRVPDASFWVGWNLQRKENYKEAVKFFLNVVEKFPSSPIAGDALYQAGVCFHSMKDYAKAADAFRQALYNYNKKLPTEGFFWLGDYLQEKGDFKEAQRVYETLLARYNEDEVVERAMLELGDALFGQGEFGEALKYYEQVLKKFPTGHYVGAAQLGMGKVYHKRGDIEEALRRLEEASKYEGEVSANAQYEIGLIYLEGGRTEEAAKYFMRVAILYDYPDIVPKALLKAGEAFQKLGQLDKARGAYEELLNRFPNVDLAEEAQKRLEKLSQDLGGK